METIKVKNMTTLKDFSALCRASLYLSGNTQEAEKGGFSFEVNRKVTGTTVIVITEEYI